MTTWVNATVHSTTFTTQTKSDFAATAGKYYGFGLFTYSGTESRWTTLAKH